MPGLPGYDTDLDNDRRKEKEMSTPEFDAYELNELIRRARTSSYYKKCHKFIMDTVLNDNFDMDLLTDKQVKWLWGIKMDLKKED